MTGGEIEPFKRGGTGSLQGFNRISELTDGQRAEYAEVAMRIRLDGSGRTTYDKIAEALNITKAQARVLVREGFMAMNTRDPETVEYLRNKQFARYETMLDSWWRRAQTDTESAEVALRILASMNAVAGLESPQRIEVRGEIAHTHADDPKETFLSILDSLERRQTELAQAATEEFDEDDIEDAEIVED